MRSIRCLILPCLVLAAATATAQPVRLAASFDADHAEIEVRDLRTDKAEAAIHAAFAEMTAMLALAESPDGSRARLHAEPAGELVDIDDRFGALLARAQQFCMWSNGAFGPLAGRLAAARLAMASGRNIEPSQIAEVMASANCANVAVRVKPKEMAAAAAISSAPAAAKTDLQAALAEGSRIDLRGWLRGFAIDRAAEVLADHGTGNFWIELGPVRRAKGSGPDSAGWPVILAFPGIDAPVASVYLRDRAMAVVMPLVPPSDRDPLYTDQRTGRDAQGIVAVAVVSELALDAEALATTVTILGLNEGKMRLASLTPAPSALVLLGDGTGPPVRSDFRWLELPQIRRPMTSP